MPDCRICGGHVDPLLVYKHQWDWCRDCGNVTRERRPRYLVPRLLPHRFALRLLPSNVTEKLYPVDEVREADARFYDYYDNASALDISGTKWREQSDRLSRQWAELGIEVAGKRVLDVSGGPGFVTKAISETAERALLTEFSDVAVAGIVDNLGIEGKTFDYQAHRIHDVDPGPFDFVVIDASINFCDDVPTFASDLRKVMAPGGAVWVSFAEPTAGCCFRWQFDEYTYNNLYRPAHVADAFTAAGFTVEHELHDEPYRFNAGQSAGLKAMRWPFDVAYRVRARLTRKPAIAWDMDQRSMAYVLRCP